MMKSCGSLTDLTIPKTLNNCIGTWTCTGNPIFYYMSGSTGKIGKELFDK